MVFRCILLLSWLGVLANAEEPFWAFQAPQRPSAPESGKSMPSSHRTDLFLNAALEAKQLRYSTMANCERRNCRYHRLAACRACNVFWLAAQTRTV